MTTTTRPGRPTSGRLPRPLAMGILCALLASLAPVPGAAAGSPAARGAATAPAGDGPEAGVRSHLRDLPLYFIANEGQIDERVDYYLQGSETSVYFTPTGVTYRLSGDEGRRAWAVKLDFVGANRVAPVGRNEAQPTINYFKGPRSEWRTDIPTYSGLVYEDLWDGIDLSYEGTGSKLKYRFIVHPGADPSDIRLSYRGARNVRLDRRGDIKVTTPTGSFTDSRPHSFQGPRGEVKGLELLRPRPPPQREALLRLRGRPLRRDPDPRDRPRGDRLRGLHRGVGVRSRVWDRGRPLRRRLRYGLHGLGRLPGHRRPH